MALKKELYGELERIVGTENISEDPAVLLGYAFTPFGIHPESGKFVPITAEAVVLPESTEDVQAVVITCNKHGAQFKAHSTGWGPWAFAGAPNVVLMDLRRMNRIIEIDEKNMFAVIEPYVLCSQLQAEAMKRGLDCHIVGAGAGHSPLASATSFQGMGNKGLTTSTNERNVLGVEWVLPTGDILRLGSIGTNAGWFSGDGPGPGLRGIMRGYMGASGGNGVFTKIGFKLYPWSGPKKPEIKGTGPQYGMKIPGNTKYCYPYWQDWDHMAEATYKIAEAGAADILTRVPPHAMDAYLTRTNTEFYELYQKSVLPVSREHRIGWNAVIMGNSSREFEYKKKVFDHIVEVTKGKFLDFTPEQESILLIAAVKVCYIPRVARPTGDFATFFGLEESVSLMKKVTEEGEKHLKGYVDAGLFVDEGPEGYWGWPYEQGRFLHWENAYSFDPMDIDSRRASLECIMKSAEIVERGGLGMAMLPNLMGPFADRFGPALGNAHVWMRKVKNAFDPKNAADPSYYVLPEEPVKG